MTPKSASCQEIGAVMQARAIKVTSVTDCKWRYGANWKEYAVTYVVVEVFTPPKGSGKQASVVANWNIGGEFKRKEVKVTNCRLFVSATTTHPAPIVTVSDEMVQDASHLAPDVTPNDVNEATPEFNVAARAVTWKREDVRTSLNGFLPRRLWKVRNPAGMTIGDRRSSNGLSPFDCFTWMFPMNHLQKIVTMTSFQLHGLGKPATSATGILKFFGIFVLFLHHEFGSRRDLRATESGNKYIPPTNFGCIMAYHRFESLQASIIFSDGGQSEDDGRVNRWNLVHDFVEAINTHRAMFVSPSDLICVDESMSRWIDVGLPRYRAIDRKSDNGCEIKNSTCGRNGTMLRMEVVKSPKYNVRDDNETGIIHGAAVTKRLVEPWANTQRILHGESYFASIETARQLYAIGLGFIGVVKTAHRGFPKSYLGSVELDNRVEWVSMIHKSDTDGDCDLGAVL